TTDQLSGLTKDNELLMLAEEYSQRTTVEAKIAKDADLLDQALLVQEYLLRGNEEVKDWFGERKLQEFNLDISKEMYKEIISTSPSEWWRGIWTNKRRE